MYQRRSSGKWSPISAGGWNASMRAAEDFEERLRSRLIENDSAADLNRTIITVRNTTNNLMGRMSVLGLGDWTFNPDTDESLNELHETLCVEGVAPVAGTHEDSFVVLPVDLDEKEIGPAVLYGLVVVKVNISDLTHKYCTISDGDTSQLKSAPCGRGRIIKAQTGTGTKYALVELGAIRAALDQVQVWTTSGSPVAGDLLAANADGLHPGRIQRWTGSGFTAAGNVWIRFTDYDGVDSGDVIAEHGHFFTGQAAGFITSGGTTKPLYLCEMGEQTFLAKADADIGKGSSGTCSLYHKSTEVDSTINKTAKALGAAISGGKWITVQRLRGGQWYAGCWE